MSAPSKTSSFMVFGWQLFVTTVVDRQIGFSLFLFNVSLLPDSSSQRGNCYYLNSHLLICAFRIQLSVNATSCCALVLKCEMRLTVPRDKVVWILSLLQTRPSPLLNIPII